MYSQSELSGIWDDIKAGKFNNAQGSRPAIVADQINEHAMTIPIDDQIFAFSRRPDGPWIETPTVALTNDFAGILRHPTQLAGAFQAGEQLTAIELQHLFRASYLMHDDTGKVVLTPYAIQILAAPSHET